MYPSAHVTYTHINTTTHKDKKHGIESIFFPTSNASTKHWGCRRGCLLIFQSLRREKARPQYCPSSCQSGTPCGNEIPCGSNRFYTSRHAQCHRVDGCSSTDVFYHCSTQLQNPGTELQPPPHSSSFPPLFLIMGSKGSFAGSHRKLKCCLMRIIRYLNQKWVPSKRRNHCTPTAELRTSTSVRWLLDSCLHGSINKIIEGGEKNHRCQILLPVSFHHLAAQRRLFRREGLVCFCISDSHTMAKW